MSQNGQAVPKAEQSHQQPILDVAWSDVSIEMFVYFIVVELRKNF